jgi:hypothetical protein
METFTDKIKRITKIIIVVALVAGGYLLATLQAENRERSLEQSFSIHLAQQINKVQDEQEKKIEKMKWQIVDDLSNKCEVLGVKDENKEGIIIWDTNNKASIGAWMFQTATVQYYSEKLRGEKLSTAEANRLALTHSEARQLAYEIIWDEVGGIYNWRNCMNKLGLKQRIETVRAIDHIND